MDINTHRYHLQNMTDDLVLGDANTCIEHRALKATLK